MKITTKKSALALILAVLMLLSAVTVGASLFAVSAAGNTCDDGCWEDTSVEEATLTYVDASGVTQTQEGTFASLVVTASSTSSSNKITNATITLNRCVVVTARVSPRVGKVAVIEGNNHTLYFDVANYTTATQNFLMNFPGGASNQGTLTIRNLNLVGQLPTWDGTMETAAKFGGTVTNGATGAISLRADMHLTMENCTIKHFYNAQKGAACFIYANNDAGSSSKWNGQPYTGWEGRGLYLVNTVISDNYCLGGTEGNDASVLKTITSTTAATAKSAKYGAHIYVSGTTRIENNYGKDGGDIGLYIKRATDIAGNEEADNRLYVMEGFTGVVPLQGDDYFPVSANTYVKGSNVRFLGTKDDRYKAVSLVVNKGTETQQISLSAEAGTETINNTPRTYYEAAPLEKPDAVTLTVMNRDGKTEIFSFVQDLVSGDALPAWDGVIWSDGVDTGITAHVKGTTAYTATWEEAAGQLVLYTTDNGANWQSNTSLRSVTRDISGVDRVEILGDADNKYVIREVAAFANSLNFVLDFNGCVVNSDHNNGRLYSEKPNVNVTIINAEFDGEGVNSKYPVVQLTSNTTNAALTFENCEFHDWTVTSTDGSAIYFGYAGSTLTLKDVKIYNNTTTSTSANKAAVRSGFNGNTNVALTLRLAGDTQIIATDEYPYNRVLGLAAVSVVDDFDGEVHIAATQTSLQRNLNDVASMPNNEQNATVAEGKKLTGVIKLDTKDLVASDINGTLRWTQVGVALPGDASEFKVVDGAVHTPLWYYLDGGVEKSTGACVEGIYQYYQREGEFGLNDSIEAYILDKICGDVATVLSAAEADDTVEIIKDAVAEGIVIAASCTVNGNNKTLTLNENNEADFISIKVEGAEVIFNDLTLHGGSPAEDYAIWNGATTALKGSNLLATDNKPTIRMNNCVITGYRAHHQAITGNAVFYFHDCAIVDNISDASANGEGHVLLGQSGSTIHFSGKTVVKDNFIVTEGEEISYTSAGVKITSSWQLYVGELTAGSDLRVETGSATTPITVGLGENGLPYNNSGMISLSEVSEVVDGKAIEVRTADKLYCSTLESQTNSGKLGASMYFINDEDQCIYQETPVTASGDLSRDNFIFNLIIPAKADFYGTDIVIKINGVEISRAPLSSYGVATGGAAYSKITIPVAVGMAELAAPVVIELQDAETETTFGMVEKSAKQYADKLIEMTLDEYIGLGYNYANDTELNKMKSAVAALLQYGQAIQTFFNIDVAPAMTEDDVAAWTELGLEFYKVDEDDIDVSNAGSIVKADKQGSVEGVAELGATLTMENQMSLRLYFTATKVDALTATVGGKEVEIVPVDDTTFYIEASNIGTADLAKKVEFKITDGTSSYIYKACPMSYVYSVFVTTGNSQINDNLKNACEALYYYYYAVANCFENVQNETGFVISGYMAYALDASNSYSAPRIFNIV